MNIGGEFGLGKVSMIRETAGTRGAEIVFENEGAEVSIYMNREQLAALPEMIGEFFRTGRSSRDGNAGEGFQPNFDLTVDLEDEGVAVEMKPLEPGKDSGFPIVLVLRNPWGGQLRVVLGVDQAQEVVRALAGYLAVTSPSHTPN